MRYIRSLFFYSKTLAKAEQNIELNFENRLKTLEQN